jgi:hypothetical protein
LEATICGRCGYIVYESYGYTWNNGHIAGLLLIDVKGAFDYVNHQRLLKTMVAKKLDGD